MEKINANEKLLSLGHKNPKDAKQVAEEVFQLPFTYKSSQWGIEFNKIRKTYEDDYTHTFAAIWILCMMISLPTWLTDWILEWLNVNLLEHFGENSNANWIRNYYKPEAD